MKELISIIVPVYNVENYIEECIKSIINQTYKNIEIIVINDGSTDRSGIICSIYADKDKRIKLINTKNNGVAKARNIGIKSATGKYITFVDSDDYVSEKYIEILYNILKKTESQISQCGAIKINSKNQVIKKLNYRKGEVKTGKEMLMDYNSMHIIENAILWNKMYEKKLFDEILFPDGRIHEDEFVTYKIIYKAKKVAIVNNELYVYRKRKNSIMEQKYNLRRLDKIIALEEKKEFFKSKNENELYLISLKQYLEELRVSYIKVKKHISNNKEICNDILKRYKPAYKEYIHTKNTTIKSKIVATMFYLLPKFFYNIKKNSFE